MVGEENAGWLGNYPTLIPGASLAVPGTGPGKDDIRALPRPGVCGTRDSEQCCSAYNETPAVVSSAADDHAPNCDASSLFSS